MELIGFSEGGGGSVGDDGGCGQSAGQPNAETRLENEAVCPWTEADAERFWGRVKIAGSDECWVYGERTSTAPNGVDAGYKIFTLERGGIIGAHRFSLMIKLNKTLPSKIFACHHCDNPPCVNPSHLYAGTPRDNMRDIFSRKRRSSLAMQRKLLADLAIKSTPAPMSEQMAEQKYLSDTETGVILGISKYTVRRLVHQQKLSGSKIGKVWRFTRASIDEYFEKSKLAQVEKVVVG